MIMRKKSGFTIVKQAIMLVPEFESVVRKLEQQFPLPSISKEEKVCPIANKKTPICTESLFISINLPG